ncbi:hypothetical protein [Diatraea saccharalis granulovirus]|uniref:Uncharacterized protein n=1 Tax=Diatraea saccharalis granulovirus TaxID=1675862 RepID=A0A0R7EYS4_9BBAC|nr:hypothetical protein [Diatraea saccharalis granulovirus]AKN80740.1 hypothetical protein [Diatraea saccharalis granulovirus]
MIVMLFVKIIPVLYINHDFVEFICRVEMENNNIIYKITCHGEAINDSELLHQLDIRDFVYKIVKLHDAAIIDKHYVCCMVLGDKKEELTKFAVDSLHVFKNVYENFVMFIIDNDVKGVDFIRFD